MATLIKIDGTLEEVFPKDPKRGFTLQELYSLLNCDWVESCGYVKDEGGWRSLVVDEEGKLNCKRVNEKATQIYQNTYNTEDYIVGDAILVTDQEFQ